MRDLCSRLNDSECRMTLAATTTRDVLRPHVWLTRLTLVLALALTMKVGALVAQESGWLGIRLADLTAEEAIALGLAKPIGARLTTILEGGPAVASGLAVNDVILSVDDIEITDSRSLVEFVGRRP